MFSTHYVRSLHICSRTRAKTAGPGCGRRSSTPAQLTWPGWGVQRNNSRAAEWAKLGAGPGFPELGQGQGRQAVGWAGSGTPVGGPCPPGATSQVRAGAHGETSHFSQIRRRPHGRGSHFFYFFYFFLFFLICWAARVMAPKWPGGLPKHGKTSKILIFPQKGIKNTR